MDDRILIRAVAEVCDPDFGDRLVIGGLRRRTNKRTRERREKNADSNNIPESHSSRTFVSKRSLPFRSSCGLMLKFFAAGYAGAARPSARSRAVFPGSRRRPG